MADVSNASAGAGRLGNCAISGFAGNVALGFEGKSAPFASSAVDAPGTPQLSASIATAKTKVRHPARSAGPNRWKPCERFFFNARQVSTRQGQAFMIICSRQPERAQQSALRLLKIRSE